MATKKQQNNDFDLSEILDTTTEHQKTLDDILTRVARIEECLDSSDKLGEKIAEAVDHSTPLRKSFGSLIVELMDDHDIRIKLVDLLRKLDRKQFWRWGKYAIAAVAWVATVVAAIFAYIAIFVPKP